LAAVDTRPTNADSPSFGFPSDAGVEVKGRYGSTQTEQTWLKSTAAVETYHYQPTLLMEDVADAGAWLLDDAAAAAVDGTRGQLDADVVAKIEGAIGDNEAMPYTAVEAIETDGASVAEIDLLAAITALAVKFRRGSVWVAAAAMTALVRGLTEAETGRRLWVDNIAVGTPPTLYGYPYIEDENVTAGNLLFGNPKRGSGVAVRQNPTLTGMERRAGDYLPCFDGRFGVCVKDARSWKVIQNAGT
jgi:HK97 family phage major capsid protein